MRRDEKAQLTWEEMRTVVISCWEELRKGEKTWDGMRRDEVKKTEKTWDEMSWGEMGCHRLRWLWDAIRNFQEKMRWDEMKCKKIQHSKRHGTGMTSQEIVAAKHRRFASTL
jgi:hypothetical protein